MLYSHDYTHQDGPEQGRGSASSYQTKVYNFPPVKVFEGEKGFTFFMPCLPLRCRKGLSVLLGNGTLRFFGLRCASRSGDERIATLEEDREERFHKAFQIAVPVRENRASKTKVRKITIRGIPVSGNPLRKNPFLMGKADERNGGK